MSYLILLALLMTPLTLYFNAYRVRCIVDYDGEDAYRPQHMHSLFFVSLEVMTLVPIMGVEVLRQINGTSMLGLAGLSCLLVACGLAVWLGSNRYDTEDNDDDDDDDDDRGRRTIVEEENEQPTWRLG
jgi:hypothetical protein